jgi:hypothetical protein
MIKESMSFMNFYRFHLHIINITIFSKYLKIIIIILKIYKSDLINPIIIFFFILHNDKYIFIINKKINQIL